MVVFWSCISLLLLRLSRLPSECYSNRLGNLGSNEEIYLVQVRLGQKYHTHPRSDRPWLELMTSRSWQYISCYWAALSTSRKIHCNYRYRALEGIYRLLCKWKKKTTSEGHILKMQNQGIWENVPDFRVMGKQHDIIGSSTTLDRSTTHPSFDLTRARTHNLQIMKIHFVLLRCLF